MPCHVEPPGEAPLLVRRQKGETEARDFTVFSAGKARQDRGNSLGLPSSNHSGRLWGCLSCPWLSGTWPRVDLGRGNIDLDKEGGWWCGLRVG